LLIVKIVGIILFSMALSLVVTVCYIKLLSVVERRYGETIRNLKLFQKICDARTNERQDSEWEVYSIQYFDNIYNFLNTNVLRIVRVIWDIWCNKKNYYTNERYNKNPNGNFKYFLRHNITAHKVGIVVIGFGLIVFAYITFSTWSIATITLRIILIATCVGAFLVGLFSLRKNYQPDNKENDTANEKLRVFVTQNTNKGTDYHQGYTHPPYHFVSPLFRRIISRRKRRCNQTQTELSIQRVDKELILCYIVAK